MRDPEVRDLWPRTAAGEEGRVSQRSGVGLAVTLLVLLGSLYFLLPIQFGGGTAYVTVTGTSMEPAYEDGDLVLTRRRADYEVGDVVLFIAPGTGDGVFRVFHRLVEEGPDGFRAQGDNRAELDRWIITEDNIVGQAAVRIPGFGTIASTPFRRTVLLAAAATMLALAVAGNEVRRRRRSRRPGTTLRRRNVTVQRPGPAAPPVLTGPWWAKGLLGVVLVLLGLLVVLVVAAQRAPTDLTITERGPEGTHTFDFAYTAIARPGLVYPDGQVGPVSAEGNREAGEAAAGGDDEENDDEDSDGIAPPQVLFRALIDEFLVDIDYELDTSGPAQVDGELRTTLVVETPEGWRDESPLGEPVPLVDGAASVQRTLDLSFARALIRQVAEAAGGSEGGGTVRIDSEVRLAGTVDGEAVEEVVEESFAVRLGSPLLEPSTDLLHTVPLAAGSATVRTEPNVVAGLRVAQWRVLAWAALAAVTAALVVLLGQLLLAAGRPEPERIAARYGMYLVEVREDPTGNAQAVPVASFAALLRLAKREQTAVLHHPRRDGRHLYVVPDGLVAFYYQTAGGPAEPGLAAADRQLPRAAGPPQGDTRIGLTPPVSLPSQAERGELLQLPAWVPSSQQEEPRS